MCLDQAGLRIAAVGPAVAAVGPSVGPDFFLWGPRCPDMSGHVWTFGDWSDIWRIGPNWSNNVQVGLYVYQIWTHIIW
jgi:hypothetical protein